MSDTVGHGSFSAYIPPEATCYTVTPPVGTAPLLKLHERLCRRAYDLMGKKNHDYTSGSGDPFANFRGSTMLGIDPILGILLRMQDKFMRVRTFAEKGQLQVKSESLEDALVDIINYAVLIGGLVQEKS